MVDETELLDLVEQQVQRREARRAFLRAFGGVAALAGGLAMADVAIAQTTSAPTDADIFNFALNFEYLESNFYSYAINGTPLPSSMTGGTGTAGAATGGRKVTFTDTLVNQFARELLFNETSQVNFIRSTLGSAAIAQPALDLSVSPTSAFSKLAQAAGLISTDQSFDPYASDVNFLIASLVFEETGVAAYKGSAALISNKTYLEAAAGILAVEAYQSGAARLFLYSKSTAMPSILTMVDAISNAKDAVDGPSDDDQGLSPTGSGATLTTNLVPADSNSIAFGRTAQNTLNIGYLTRNSVSAGGFFPNGVNGNIRTSNAN